MLTSAWGPVSSVWRPSRAMLLRVPLSAEPGTPTAPTQAPAVTPSGGAAGGSAPGPAISSVNGGQYLAVITYGSGSCPDGLQSTDVVAYQEIEVRLGPLFPGRDPCTADLSAYLTVVELPQGVTPTQPLTARFGERTVTNPAAGR